MFLWDLFGLSLRLRVRAPPRRDGLGSAIDDSTILQRSLDEPVRIAGTEDAGINASGAKVIVALVTDATVEVSIGNGGTAIVAVDAEVCEVLGVRPEAIHHWVMSPLRDVPCRAPRSPAVPRRVGVVVGVGAPGEGPARIQ